MNITPAKSRSSIGESALTAWKAWVALNTNELSWIVLAGTAIVLAGLYTHW